MKKVCKNCQYFREGKWCSNFGSNNFRYSAPVDIFVSENDKCDEFMQPKKKAPLWMRLFNKIMRRRKR